MFTKLTDFGFKRKPKQAFGFYLVYFGSTILVAMVIAMLIANGYQEGVRVGTASAVLICWGLSFLILKGKKKLNQLPLVALAVGSGLLAVLGGGLLGLIPTAYLTTK